MFSVFDTVMVCKNPIGATFNMVGKIVEIVCFREDGLVGCKFDFEDPHLLHTCRGVIETRSGLFLPKSCLAPLDGAEDNPDFEPALDGDVCDISGEKADYRVGGLKFAKKYARMVVKCDLCGTYHYANNIHYSEDGSTKICDSCVESRGYVICDDCGCYLNMDSATIVNFGRTNMKIVCSKCLTNNEYFQCSDCGGWFSVSELSDEHDGVRICKNCGGNWTTCYDCGALVRRDNGNYYDGVYWCPEHHPRNRAIHDYGYKPSPVFYGRSDEERSLFMGVELEIDGGQNRNATAKSINNERTYCKRDGSLGSSGIEIVTHPCTLSYHMNDFGWKHIINVARTNRYQSHKINTCGLHVHVNKSFFGDREEVEVCTARILVIFQQHWNEIVKFSRRKEYELNRWAGKAINEFGKDDSREYAREKVRDERYEGDRYKAVNLQNENTIEFRVFRGTLKYNTLIATLQFVNGICHYVTRKSLSDIYSESWGDFISSPEFDYPELKAYLVERRLISE